MSKIALIAEIDDQVGRIAQIVAHLPPKQLLQRAWYEYANVVGKDDRTISIAYQMIDYVQSVIAGVKPCLPYADRVTNADWIKLKEEVQSLFTTLSCDYQIILTLYNQIKDPGYDEGMEEFRFQEEIYWMHGRGKRYKAHERQALLDLLSPHSAVLCQLFGLDAQFLVDEILKILAKQATGFFEAMRELRHFYEDTRNMEESISRTTGITDRKVLAEKTLECEHFARRRDKIAGEAFGLDLFDVEIITQLPQNLLKELAWRPGEDKEFFAPGRFCGWPLRIWPTMKRPFIQLDGQILSFDQHSLFDNFYRVLQRVVCRLKPEYEESWNKHQKSISEELPFTYLKRILPDAQIYRSVYYDLRRNGWSPAETDGILVYEDHLFIIEIKAGSFIRSSPANDLPARIESVKSLVAKPIAQGSRLVDLLEIHGEIPLYDNNSKKNKNEVFRLHQSHFRHITVCAVTLDPFTEIAARHQHLQDMPIDIGKRPTWALSIDDLRVYADLFNNPLIFLHYVEQRMLAANSSLINLDDEYEHLGLYFYYNNYCLEAEQRSISSPHANVLFSPGYKKPIDEYFDYIMRRELGKVQEKFSKPGQDIPPRLKELIHFLSVSDVKGRSGLASWLLSLDGKCRKIIDSLIMISTNNANNSCGYFAVSFDGRNPFSLCIWKSPCSRQKDIALEYAQKASVSAKNDNSRILIELEYTTEGDLIGVHWQNVNFSGLTQDERERIVAQGIALRKERERSFVTQDLSK